MHKPMPIACELKDATFSKERKPIASTSKSGSAVHILRSMYGLKQSGQIWFHKFHDEMLAMGFSHDDITSCLFIIQEPL